MTDTSLPLENFDDVKMRILKDFNIEINEYLSKLDSLEKKIENAFTKLVTQELFHLTAAQRNMKYKDFITMKNSKDSDVDSDSSNTTNILSTIKRTRTAKRVQQTKKMTPDSSDNVMSLIEKLQKWEEHVDEIIKSGPIEDNLKKNDLKKTVETLIKKLQNISKLCQ